MAGSLSVVLGNVAPGSFVGIYMNNCEQWLELFWALLMQGYRPLLVNNRMSRSVLEDIISQSIDATSKNNDDIIASVKHNTENIISSVNQSNDSILSALTQYSEVIRSNRSDLRPPEVIRTEAPAAGGVTEATSEGPEQAALNLDMLN